MNTTPSLSRWRCRQHQFDIGQRPLIMGIVNVTPDSFSDGGQYSSTSQAVEHGLKLIADGADILDIGGESTRPGATPVSLDEELHRVIPVVEQLARQSAIPISVDTSKAEVARLALEAGACIVNDVSALQADPRMAEVVQQYQAGVVLMHMQGNPSTMQHNPHYVDVVADIGDFFSERIAFAKAAGIDEESIALDPGIGFGKSFDDTLMQLRKLGEYQRFGRPICLAVSRKGFIGMITSRPRSGRAVGSVAVACHAIQAGAAQIIRVHDVAEHRDAVLILDALG